MKTIEEIEQLAEKDFNDRQKIGHYELSDLKSTDYYYDGFCNAYTQCQEDMIKELKEWIDMETIEEAAERLWLDSTSQLTSKNSFIQGAKWQQERMFELVEEYNQMLLDTNVHEDHKEKSFKEWFEQFKKK